MHTEIDVRSDTGQCEKNNHSHRRSDAIDYLNEGTGDEDDAEGFAFEVLELEGAPGVIG